MHPGWVCLDCPAKGKGGAADPIRGAWQHANNHRTHRVFPLDGEGRSDLTMFAVGKDPVLWPG